MCDVTDSINAYNNAVISAIPDHARESRESEEQVCPKTPSK